MTTRDAVRALLKENEFVSGQEIASRLGLTRAAVAKAVSRLREEGCEIDAVRKRGYLLRQAPDVLSEATILRQLPEDCSCRRLTVLDSADSTNNVLRQMAEQGVEAGTAVLAEQQTAGRGRMGRSFVSPYGVGIYLSVLLRPQCPPVELMTLTAQTAVAVRRAINGVCGVEPEIKWVNDLLLNDKKICGILTELSVEAETSRVNYAIVGVGVNCNQSEEDFPEELRGIAGSIRSQTGRRVDRNALAAALLRTLSQLPEIDWLAEYRAACVTLGKQVRILSGREERDAFALDVGQTAELIVRYGDGTTGAVNSGEVRVRRIS